LLVFTVKAAIHDPQIGVGKIFAGSSPYWIVLLAVIVLLWYFPGLASYLPGLLKN
jgi:TRAP-type mannitol/chloroaromatic compound transport system permease large subunit